MSKRECGLPLVYVRMGVFGNDDDHSSLNGNKCNYPTFLDGVQVLMDVNVISFLGFEIALTREHCGCC